MKEMQIVALLAGTLLLSHFSVVVGSTNYNAAAEHHRSTARYRQFFQHEDRIALMRHLLQVDQKMKDKLPGSTLEVNSTDLEPEKDFDESLLALDTVEKHEPVNGNSTDNPANQKSIEHSEKLVEENQLGQDVIDREERAEGNVNETQAVKNSQEKPNVEAKIDDSDSASKIPSIDIDPEERVTEIQRGQDSIERGQPAEKIFSERQTNESAEAQLQDSEEDIVGNQQEAVEGEILAEKSTEEDPNQNLEIGQHQQKGSDKDGGIEQKLAEEQQEGEERKGGEEASNTAEEEPFVLPEPYLLGPTINDWDEQRANWLEQNPNMKSADDKPKVLIVTGSQPGACRSSKGDFFNLQSLKLKMDYARMHNYEIYYNFAWLDPLFGSFWVKLPIIRKLMLTHPEIEWFFWIDSDAVFTDMLFEPPFHTYEGSNMVMWGYYDGVYIKKSWTDFNAGVFFIRNCQWSLDLIDKWSPMGPDGPVREHYGKMLSAFLTDRASYHDGDFPADDQSALVYLMITDEAVKSKVKLVDHAEYMISGWWVDTVPLYNRSMEKYHPGLGDTRWPFVTHFTGCSPCGGDEGSDDYAKCMESFETAFNFADNQILAYMGFQHKNLSSPEVIRRRNETDRPLELLGVSPWAERIAQVAASGISPW